MSQLKNAIEREIKNLVFHYETEDTPPEIGEIEMIEVNGEIVVFTVAGIETMIRRRDIEQANYTLSAHRTGTGSNDVTAVRGKE